MAANKSEEGFGAVASAKQRFFDVQIKLKAFEKKS